MCPVFAAVAPTLIRSAYLTSDACIRLSAVCRTTHDDIGALADFILQQRAKEDELHNEALERGLLAAAELDQAEAEFEDGFYSVP